jgi:broad specificity phosphatase PhoE
MLAEATRQAPSHRWIEPAARRLIQARKTKRDVSARCAVALAAMNAASGTTACTTLYLARHGQSEWNHGGRVTGRMDPALSDLGHEQSRALATCVQGEGLDAIYASALRRTAQTATPASIATGVPIRRLAALDEIGMGELEGRWRDERDPAAQAQWVRWKAQPWLHTVPGGESLTHFTERVLTALRSILEHERGKRVLIVGHGATNRVLLGTLLEWPREYWPEIRPRNKYCYRLRLGGGAVPEVATFTLGGRRSGRCETRFVN